MNGTEDQGRSCEDCDEPAVWLAGTFPSVHTLDDLGAWCATHLGGALNGYDGTVTLTNVGNL